MQSHWTTANKHLKIFRIGDQSYALAEVPCCRETELALGPPRIVVQSLVFFSDPPNFHSSYLRVLLLRGRSYALVPEPFAHSHLRRFVVKLKAACHTRPRVQGVALEDGYAFRLHIHDRHHCPVRGTDAVDGPAPITRSATAASASTSSPGDDPAQLWPRESPVPRLSCDAYGNVDAPLVASDYIDPVSPHSGDCYRLPLSSSMVVGSAGILGP